MREDNKSRTLLGRMLLKIHSSEEPRLCEADIRRAVMIPEQLSKVDSCSPDVERLQSHSTQSVLLANAMQGKMWDFLVSHRYSSSTAIANRNSLVKFQEVCVRKGSSNISYVPDRPISILFPLHQDTCFCLLCLQLCCTWCGWCCEKPDALCTFIIPVGSLSLEHSLPTNPIALMLDNTVTLQKQSFATLSHMW